MNTNNLKQLQSAYIYALAAHQTCCESIADFLDNDLEYLAKEQIISEKRRLRNFDDEYRTLLKETCEFSIEVDSNFKRDEFRDILRAAEELLIEEFKNVILSPSTPKPEKFEPVLALFTTDLYKKVLANLQHRQRLINIIMKFNTEN